LAGGDQKTSGGESVMRFLEWQSVNFVVMGSRLQSRSTPSCRGKNPPSFDFKMRRLHDQVLFNLWWVLGSSSLLTWFNLCFYRCQIFM
jgi:hypothetical protein